MNNVNQWTGTGRLGRDIELKYLPSGSCVANFSMCVAESYKKGEDWIEDKSWIDITAWGKSAEMLKANARKGDVLFISGKLKQQKWQGRDGEEKSKLVVQAMTAAVLVVPRKAAAGDAVPAQEKVAEDVGDGENLPF